MVILKLRRLKGSLLLDSGVFLGFLLTIALDYLLHIETDSNIWADPRFLMVTMLSLFVYVLSMATV